MRILIAAPHLGHVGGVETYLAELLPALAARGHEIALLYEHNCETGRTAVNVGMPEMPCWHLGTPTALAEAERWRPEICYSQGLTNPDVEQGLLARFTTVLFAHNYHGTCISGTKRHAFPLARPCERIFGAACLGLYFPRRCGGLNPLTMFKRFATEQQRRGMLTRYRKVLVASHHMVAEYQRNGVSSDRLERMALFAPRMVPDADPPGAQTPSGRVLLIGRLTDLKGGTVLVRAVARAGKGLDRPLTLVVAGDGPEREAMNRLAHRLHVAIEFHGWLDRPSCVALMRSADVLAVPSVWPEPFGLVGIEAACVGLPAVGFAVGGIPDWLLSGETGELAPGDPPRVDGLAQALVRSLGDASHLTNLRRGAWASSHGFSLQAHCASLERALMQCAATAIDG